jgi:hypothetical protein
MSLSRECMETLSNITRTDISVIERLEPTIIKEIESVIKLAQHIKNSEKIRKKTISLILKEKGYNFI